MSRELLLQGLCQQVVGDNPELVQRRQRPQPIHRLLDHGLLAIQRQHLLGARAAAARPKAGPAAAGQ
jgi:hypothetical protein